MGRNPAIYTKYRAAKMPWRPLLVLILHCVSKGISQETACKTNKTCDCCNSHSVTGLRNLNDICNGKQGNWGCNFGCIDGYWGFKCWNYCPASCINCDLQYQYSKICYSCHDGYYGTNCSSNCPTNCAENKCDKTTGNWLKGCTNNWSGDKCNVCANTWYGNNCEIRCPDICKDRKCDKNGECITGCSDDNFDGPHCDQCKIGRYGENCDNWCPVNCKNSICDRYNGTCTNGCERNFGGNKCYICKPSYFGEDCDKLCSNYLNGMCDRSTGKFIECTYNNVSVPKASSPTWEIAGGIIAGNVIITIMSHVLCFIWRRRQIKETKKDPSVNVNSTYVNDHTDHEGYEELQIPNH